MNWFRYSAVVMLALWTAFTPARADAQEIARIHHFSRESRPLLLTLPEAPQIQQRRGWLTSARFPAGGDAAGVMQDPRNRRSERSLGRKVFGAAVGATGGFFGGAVVGGILGWRYLF